MYNSLKNDYILLKLDNRIVDTSQHVVILSSLMFLTTNCIIIPAIIDLMLIQTSAHSVDVRSRKKSQSVSLK